MKNIYSEGYSDPTAYNALKRASGASERHSVRTHDGCKRSGDTTDEEWRFNKVLKTIFSICDLAGIEVVDRIVLRDKTSGRVWK